MRESDEFFAVIFITCIAFLLGIWVAHNEEASKAIEQCESELPRNQTCKIVAVPEEVGK